MALSGDELRKRVAAAAALYGLGMRDVRFMLKDFGAHKTLSEAMVRGEKPMNPKNLRDLSVWSLLLTGIIGAALLAV